MKALFIHDHPFVKDKNTGMLYTSGNLNSEIWERYLKHFDSVTVIGRCKSSADTSRFHAAEKEGVTFKLFTDVSGGVDYFKKRSSIEEKLRTEIDNHDVVIMRFPATISIFAADYCIKKNIKYIAEVVGCSWDANWNYGGLGTKLLAPYSYFKMKKAVKYASAAIYVTEKFLQGRYPSQASITASASNVIVKEIKEDALPKRMQKIEHEADTINLGIIGNIAVRYKGYDVLLKAINGLPSNLKERIRLYVVGGGDAGYLNRLIKDANLENQVIIKGKLKAGQEIFDFLDTLDVYVHPSRQEGLPRVVIEAMSRACPVLASDVAGTPELINSLCVHKSGDYRKLTDDIIRMSSDNQLKKDMAEENFNKSKEYIFSTLEARREEFFKSFKASL